MTTSQFQDVLLRVKESADIVQIVGQYVPLKRAGGRYLGVCPFHNDRHPSMNVNPRLGIYKCFACGAGGDAIKFVQEYERVGFAEALRLVAAKAGIVLPEHLAFGDKSENDKTSVAAQVNTLALQIYSESLEKSPAALEYLQTRGLKPETIKHFQIGFAPETPDLILQRARAKEIPVHALVEAGLLGEAAGGRLYHRFAGRLIFPIFNLSGRVIGFGGRVLPGREGAKYINTPESALYQKSRVLYGFHSSRGAVDQSGEAVVVEGYMDLVSLWQAGVKNAVAVCGTALTADHARLLTRFARKVFLLFDGDAAGRTAVRRSLESLLEQGIEVRVPVLPEADDPDSFVKSHSEQGIQALFDESEDVTDFLIRATGKTWKELSPEEKEALWFEASDFFKDSLHAVREERLQALRKRLQLPPTILRIAKSKGSVAVQDSELGLFVLGANITVRPEALPEWKLLQLLLAYPATVQAWADSIDLTWFSDERVRDLFDHALALLAEQSGLPLRALRDRVPEILQDALAALEIPEGEAPVFLGKDWSMHAAAIELRHLKRAKREAASMVSQNEVQKRIDILNSRKGETP